ncbi:MAG: DUF3800 domain-containing protein, partial [Bradymonadaceae bacterium]
GEVKWSQNSRAASRCAMMEWFFEQPWLCFQSLLVHKDAMRIFEGRKQRSVAYRKLLCTLLATQIDRFDGLPGGPRRFEVAVDETGETTRSLTEEEFDILVATTRKWLDTDRDLVDDFRRVDSRSSRGVQLADLFVGALRASWEDDPTGARGEVAGELATQLGWNDLQAATEPNLKFNVWLHRDSFDRAPGLETRELRLEQPSGDPEGYFPPR